MLYSYNPLKTAENKVFQQQHEPDLKDTGGVKTDKIMVPWSKLDNHPPLAMPTPVEACWKSLPSVPL